MTPAGVLGGQRDGVDEEAGSSPAPASGVSGPFFGEALGA